MPAPRPRYDPKYEREGDWVTHKYVQSTGDTLRFQARDIRRGPTGVHARVVVSYNQIALGTDVFNVERDRDRTHLINVCKKRMLEREYGLDMKDVDLGHAFDLFCEGLWEQQLALSKYKLLEGKPHQVIKQLVRGLVVEGGGTAIYSPPGQGKTYCLLTLAVCIDAGLSIPGAVEVLHREPALFINLERSEYSMEYRLGRVNQALGLPEARGLPFINARGKSLRDIYQAAEQSMRELESRVVVLDSLSRAGSGSMVDDEDANQAMDMLNGLAPTWVLSAHTPRSDESHLFGSVMFDAAVDVGVRLTSQQRNGSTGVGLQVTKENDLGKKPLHIVAFDWGVEGLERVRHANRGEFPDIVEGKAVTLAEDITQFLLQVGKMSGTAIAQNLGRERASVARELRNNDRFTVAEVRGKEVLYAVRQGTGS